MPYGVSCVHAVGLAARRGDCTPCRLHAVMCHAPQCLRCVALGTSGVFFSVPVVYLWCASLCLCCVLLSNSGVPLSACSVSCATVPVVCRSPSALQPSPMPWGLHTCRAHAAAGAHHTVLSLYRPGELNSSQCVLTLPGGEAACGDCTRSGTYTVRGHWRHCMGSNLSSRRLPPPPLSPLFLSLGRGGG